MAQKKCLTILDFCLHDPLINSFDDLFPRNHLSWSLFLSTPWFLSIQEKETWSYHQLSQKSEALSCVFFRKRNSEPKRFQLLIFVHIFCHIFVFTYFHQCWEVFLTARPPSPPLHSLEVTSWLQVFQSKKILTRKTSGLS